MKSKVMALFFACFSSIVFAESSPSLRMGRYTFNETKTIMEIKTDGITIYNGTTAVCDGTYRINGNSITITFCNASGMFRLVNGKTINFTITSNTSFTGNGMTFTLKEI